MNTLARRAFTLVELLVTLAMMGVFASVATLAFREPPTQASDDPIAQALTARRTAIREGRTVTIEVATDSGVVTVSAFADGSVVAGSPLRIGRLDAIQLRERQ